MIKRIVGLFGSAVLATGVADQTGAIAANSIRIFNVDVFLDQPPPCALGPATPIKASASPFQAQVSLGDLITELARKAAEVGGKIVYDVKLVSFIPYQGAIATAMVASCTESKLLPSSYDFLLFSSDLLNKMLQAKAVQGFSFDDSTSGPLRSVSASKPLPLTLKDGSSIDSLRILILARSTYDLTPSLRKSCPFLPSFGFAMMDKSDTVWWLVSELCQTAALVLPDTDWRQTQVMNLSAAAIFQFRSLFAPHSSPK
jgi:hypothetical protein